MLILNIVIVDTCIAEMFEFGEWYEKNELELVLLPCIRYVKQWPTLARQYKHHM
jgi:hypothetical protein